MDKTPLVFVESPGLDGTADWLPEIARSCLWHHGYLWLRLFERPGKDWIAYNDKKENKIFLRHKESRRERLQSHIWLTASSYMTKYLRISSYIRKPFLIYDLATAPFWNFLIYEENVIFFFISVGQPSPAWQLLPETYCGGIEKSAQYYWPRAFEDFTQKLRKS